MPPNVKVCINGFVLSTLLYDCNNNSSDQEGFLYGSVTRNVRREISDHSMSNTQEDILINICSSVPCGSCFSFYNSVGEIKREDLEYSLGERAENIVGWYRFRRYSAMVPSVREQSTHRNLRNLFATHHTLHTTSYFVYAVLSSSNLPNYATHSYDYGFFIQRHDGTFRDLPMTILNLGDTRNSYRTGSMALPFMNSSSFNSVLSSSWNFSAIFETENQIHEFHQRLRTKLESLQEELAASDAVNASLESDIKRISSEMQSLLAAQENAAAARELELAEANAATKQVEDAETATVLAEVSEPAKVKEKKSGGKIAAATESKISGAEKRKIEDVKEEEENENLESVKKVITDSIVKKIIQDQGDGPMVSSDSVENSGSPNSKEKGTSSSSLKRAFIFSSEDDRTTKRACPDKYFESVEYLKDKSTTSSGEEVTSSFKKDTATDKSQMEVVPHAGELSTRENVHGNFALGITSEGIEELSPIPSSASTVEIVISDVGLQSVGSALIEDEIISSSDDEFLDTKEDDVKETLPSASVEQSVSVSENTKSLSDSAISCKKDDVSDRCGSAPAEFLSQSTSSVVKDKSATDELVTKTSTRVNLTSRAKPPFIIYATKESKPVESSGDESGDKCSHSSPSHDHKDCKNKDISQSSDKKLE